MAAFFLFAINLASCSGGGGGGSSGEQGSGAQGSGGTAQPTPTAVGTNFGSASTGTIGATGGTLSSLDSGLTVSIPAGALTKDTIIGIQPITNNAHGKLGIAYRMTPDGLKFSNPVSLTLKYDDAELNGTSADALGVAFQTADGYWQWVSDPVIDTTAKTITVTTSHFSDFSGVKGFVIDPASKTILANTSVTLSVWSCYDPGGDPPEIRGYGYVCEPATTESGSPVRNATVSEWSVNGIPGGNETVGSVISLAEVASYSAPWTKPTPATVNVTARVSAGGKTTLATSQITITEKVYSGTLYFDWNNDLYQLKGSGSLVWHFDQSYTSGGETYTGDGQLTAIVYVPGCNPFQTTLFVVKDRSTMWVTPLPLSGNQKGYVYHSFFVTTPNLDNISTWCGSDFTAMNGLSVVFDTQRCSPVSLYSADNPISGSIECTSEDGTKTSKMNWNFDLMQ